MSENAAGGFTIDVVRWSQATLPQAVLAFQQEAADAGIGWMAHCAAEWAQAPFLCPDEGLFLAYGQSECVGMAVIGQDRLVSDTQTARLRYVFVTKLARRRGVAEALVVRCLALADEHWRRTTLHTDNPGAEALYRRYGFVRASGEVARITHERFNPRAAREK